MDINSPSFTQGGGTDLKIPEVTEYPTEPHDKQLINFNGQLTSYNADASGWSTIFKQNPYTFYMDIAFKRGFLRDQSATPGSGFGTTTYAYAPWAIQGVTASINDNTTVVVIYFVGPELTETDISGFVLNDTVTLYTKEHDYGTDEVEYLRTYSPTYSTTAFRWILPLGQPFTTHIRLPFYYNLTNYPVTMLFT